MKPEVFLNLSTESPSLANYLTWSIDTYLRKFNKKPNVIRMPIWRKHELEDELLDNSFTSMSVVTGKNSFNGIPLIYTVGFNHIELQ